MRDSDTRGAPTWLRPDFDTLKDALGVMIYLKNWVVTRPTWKDGSWRKPPMHPSGRYASVTNSDSWCEYEEAREAVSSGVFDALGFVMTQDCPDITVIDLDDCVDGKKIKPWAVEIVKAAKSYTEFSPSGTGLRIIMHGATFHGQFENDAQGVEVYVAGSRRYLTITGRLVSPQPEFAKIAPISREFEDVLEPYVQHSSSSNNNEQKDPVDGVDLAGARAMLAFLEAAKRVNLDGYDDWLRLGMALHHQFNGDPEGLELWDDISSRFAGYDDGACQAKWDSFGGGSGEVTLRTYIKEARSAGYSAPFMGTQASADDFPDLSSDEPAQGPVEPTEGPEDPLKGLGIYSASTAAARPVTPYIIKTLLAQHQVSALAGPPSAGKTFFGLELIRSVSSGEDFWGLKCKKGTTLLLAFEGEEAVNQRIAAWEHEMQQQFPKNVYIATPPAGIQTEEFEQWLIKVVRLLGPRLIVVDTFAQATPGLDENSNEDVGPVLSKLRHWAHIWPIHICLIHHPNKSGTSALRGASAIEGAIDAIIEVSVEDRNRVARVTRQRLYGTDDREFIYTLDRCLTGRMDEDGEIETGARLVRHVERVNEMPASVAVLDARVEEALEEAGGVQIEKDQWLTIKEVWLNDVAANYNENARRELTRQALAALNKKYLFHRGGNQQINLVTFRTNNQ